MPGHCAVMSGYEERKGFTGRRLLRGGRQGSPFVKEQRQEKEASTKDRGCRAVDM